MKCPSCGEEIEEGYTLVPVWGHDGEFLDCIHLETHVWEAFRKRGLSLEDIIKKILAVSGE